MKKPFAFGSKGKGRKPEVLRLKRTVQGNQASSSLFMISW